MTEVPGGSKGVAFTNWLVSKAAGVLERKSSRRGFILGSAMVGSAVAVAGCAPGTPAGRRRTTTSPTAPAASAPTATPSSAAPSTTGSTPARRARFVARLVARRLLHRSATAPATTWTAMQYVLRPEPRQRVLRRLHRVLAVAAAATRGGSTATTSATGSATRRSGSSVRSPAGSSRARRRTPSPSTRAPPRSRSTTRTAEHAPAHGCTPPPPPRISCALLPAAGAVAEPTPGKLAVLARRPDGGMNAAGVQRQQLERVEHPGRVAHVGHRRRHGGHRPVRLPPRQRQRHAGGASDRTVAGGRPGRAWPGTSRPIPPSRATGAASTCSDGARTTPLWYNRLTIAGWAGSSRCSGTSIRIRWPRATAPASTCSSAAATSPAWYRRIVNGAPGPFLSLGGYATSDPAAAVTSTGPVVVTRSAYDTVVVRHFQNGGPLGDWKVVGGNATSDPVLCSGPSGTFLFVRGNDNAIWYTQHTGGTSWTPLDVDRRLGPRRTPVAVSDSTGVSVLVRRQRLGDLDARGSTARRGA